MVAGGKQIPKLISKTKIMLGYQCPKNIYLAVHQKNLIPPVTPELQALFDQGNQVTEEARKRYPNGVLVDFPAYDFIGSLQKTRELLKNQTEVIFEAAFEYKGCYARADVIKYNPLNQRWSIIEVKSTTKVKDEHLDDVGLQAWIMANAGLPIEKISVMHLNPLCKFPNLDNLFIEEDVTEQLRQRYNLIVPKMNEIFSTIRSDQVPQIDVGPHCFKPRECQFFEHCSSEKNIPDYSVFSIPRLREKKWELYQNGMVEPESIDESLLEDQQKVFLQVLRTGKRHVDHEAIKKELANWQFPLVFLDFETINPAIPRYDGVGPFTQVPFQFSVHILESIDSPITHYEFLHSDKSDPRPELIKALIKACGTKGSVVAYYSVFESNCIQDLESYSPEYAESLKQIRQRLVDPLPVFREYVYDKKFKDSFSIKSVGPAILGDQMSYEHMAVGDGGAAQRAFEQLINTNDQSEAFQIKTDLLEYCKKDTLVMVELVKWLYQC